MTAFNYIATIMIILAFISPQSATGYQTEELQFQPQRLFDGEEVIDIRLEGDIESLLQDRGEDPSYHILKLHAKIWTGKSLWICVYGSEAISGD